ncbi:hypothetical protein COC42_06115 [Sphingomonas spermidinifaciens]|uniref:Uncharacterized protein n=1 Tax=Sphingomonas spermidinifaciens TaxID=1141889 RepID=A0A2A4B742_9SPHN|nr:hypothetical protein [Sphingomonas spermidinifaciens]PCD03900.1 hypothetical protein COC42_06115 [Sphingomonas spermidinifaciens]
MSRVLFAYALLPLALASCGKSKTEVAAPVPPPPPVMVERPMPRPPQSAAANLTLPAMMPDGSFVTPSRGLSPMATAWHLRAALNVAVLQCAKAGEPMETQYNAFLAAHKSALGRAHDGLKAEYRARYGAQWQDRFDDDMTRLYNFYAQPPARAAFCRAAGPLVAAAATTPAGALDGFAAPAVAALDVPFTDFYRAYAAYRTDLAAWQADRFQPASTPVQVATVQPVPLNRAPILTVTRDLLMSDTEVTSGSGR